MCPRPHIAYGTLHAAYHILVAVALVVVVVVVAVVVVVGILRATNLMLHIRFPHTVCPRPIAYGTLHAAYHILEAVVLVVVVVVVVV